MKLSSSYLSWCVLCAIVILAPVSMAGGDPNECDVEGEIPDIIVGDLHDILRWAQDGVSTAFSVATTSCNQGTCQVSWTRDSPDHPTIAQSMYRLKDGRLEQIGISWLKHGFFAVSGTLCFDDCVGTDGSVLGVHCSDPYSAAFNGDQATLGPRFEVNPSTGVFPFPFTTSGETGDGLYKRLQVRNDDLDPTLNAGAQYFVEGHYINEDDATARTDENNASYRPITIRGTGGVYFAELADVTVPTLPAIHAWPANQPGVALEATDIPEDGRITIAAAVTEIVPGRYRYEYAIHNLNSHRAGRSFTVPLPAGALVEDAGFHDVDYHSGEPFELEDWGIVVESDSAGDRIRWSTVTYDTNPDANALRWGTMYNFWFETDAPPVDGPVQLELFRPGMPASVSWTIAAPRVCDADGTCEPGETCSSCAVDCLGQAEFCCGDGECVPCESACDCPADCGRPFAMEIVCDDGLDLDCDGLIDCADSDCCATGACDTAEDKDGDGVAGCDCDDDNGAVWGAPGEVLALRLDQVSGLTELVFDSPVDPGGSAALFDVLRAALGSDLVLDATCVVADSPVGLASDGAEPVAGAGFQYLVRATNDCPVDGSLGTASSGAERTGRSCP